jgi:hypothetical protein
LCVSFFGRYTEGVTGFRKNRSENRTGPYSGPPSPHEPPASQSAQGAVLSPLPAIGRALAWLIALTHLSDLARGQDPKVDFFETKIRPVLVERCYECHSVKASELGGQLRLDAPSAMRRGGSMGASLVPGSVEQSLIVRAIEYGDSNLQMPPDGKLPQEQIDDFKQWIAEGAIDPRPDTDSLTSDPTTARMALAAKHWAYQPLAEPATIGTPASMADWDPIDVSISAKLQAQQLALSDEADRRTLVRRLYYDLVGLPPTFDEIEAVVNNPSGNWYRELVENLLQSPHFGERMARRWMDVVRYADNKGYVFQENREYAHAYRYRDWLIRSFQQDLPYDQFLRFQLIGDRLDPENAAGHLDAMGMLTLGRRFLNNKHDIVDDRIDVVTRGLLGVTANCARCHDHKFDPVTMADYYSLAGAFMESEEPGGDPSPMRLVDRAEQGKTHILVRGNPGNQGPEVPRRFIAFLHPASPVEMKTASGRLEMADAIASDRNPLTARVWVNRVWGWITESHLVDTPSDFGLRTEPPVQQFVLDSLAWDFVRKGWSTKELIRRIAMLKTYRQRSEHRDEAYTIDPENRLLWRANRKRMDFESYRDALLQATGRLDRAIGGPSFSITAPPFSNRRTVYAYIDRQNLPQLFRSFDFATPDVHVPQRSQTTVPQQGLVLFNSDMVMGLLDGIAGEASRRGRDAGIDYLFEQVLARRCADRERAWVTELIDANDLQLPDAPENQWTYGTATFEPNSGRIENFRPLPRFINHRWQGMQEQLPDPEFDWALLSASQGHPGAQLDQTIVRRWTARSEGTLRVRGILKHLSVQGNGVRSSIIVRGTEKLGQWTIANGETETRVDDISVQPGDTIDFATDSLGDSNSDTFEWKVRIVSNDESQVRANSERHFSSEQPHALSVWEQAAQALLLTNEFCFID